MRPFLSFVMVGGGILLLLATTTSGMAQCQQMGSPGAGMMRGRGMGPQGMMGSTATADPTAMMQQAQAMMQMQQQMQQQQMQRMRMQQQYGQQQNFAMTQGFISAHSSEIPQFRTYAPGSKKGELLARLKELREERAQKRAAYRERHGL